MFSRLGLRPDHLPVAGVWHPPWWSARGWGRTEPKITRQTVESGAGMPSIWIYWTP